MAKIPDRKNTATRRMVLGAALAAAVPAASGGRFRTGEAKSATATWMYAGNAARTGVFAGPGLDLSKEVIELWRIDEQRNGNFVDPCGVCDGIAYYRPIPGGVSPEVKPLVAVDATTGTELWRKDPPVSEPRTSFWGGPAIADGLLVMPTLSGLLVGMDAKTGEERWLFDLQGQTSNCHPALVDGVIYASDNAAVNAIAIGNEGEWLWKTSLGDGVSAVVSGTVSVDGDYVVVSSIGSAPESEQEEEATTIHVLDKSNGSELYRYQFQDVGRADRFAIQDGMLYSQDTLNGGAGRRSYFFSMTIDGDRRWTSRKPPQSASYPAVSGDFVCLAHDTTAFCLDAATGEMLWQTPLSHDVYPAVVLIDDVMYVGGASSTSSIFALDPTNGRLLKTIDVPFEGAQIAGNTDGGILIVRSGMNLIALANLE